MAVAVAAISWFIFTAWPRPYDRFVTEALDSKGTRAEFLIPRGWILGSNELKKTGMLYFRPPERPHWWPGWLRRWLPADDPVENSVVCWITNGVFAKTLADLSGEKIGVAGGSCYVAVDNRDISRDVKAVLIVARTTEQAMQSNRRDIMGSFRLLRATEH